MTQSQIYRLKECKKKALEVKNELLNIWSEIELSGSAMGGDTYMQDIKIINAIGIPATDLVTVFNRHDKII